MDLDSGAMPVVLIGVGPASQGPLASQDTNIHLYKGPAHGSLCAQVGQQFLSVPQLQAQQLESAAVLFGVFFLE